MTRGWTAPEHLRAGFRLGEWLVEPDLDRLSLGERTVRLQPLVMDLLVLLASRPGSVVPQRTLVDVIWEGRLIAATTLARAIADLRSALDDEARRPRYIETIPKRGYRLIAPVRPCGPSPRAPSDWVVEAPAGTVELPPGEHLIGRSAHCTLELHAPQVSREHARVTVNANHVVIEDLDSKHGTWVAGRRLTAPTELTDGERVLIATVDLVFRRLREPTTTI